MISRHPPGSHAVRRRTRELSPQSRPLVHVHVQPRLEAGEPDLSALRTPSPSVVLEPPCPFLGKYSSRSRDKLVPVQRADGLEEPAEAGPLG